MNRLSPQKQETAIHMLLEGCSIRSTERMTGIHRDAIMRLMVRAGCHCDELSRQHIRGFRPSVVEVDEAWPFVAKKDKRLTSADPETVGSQWIFIAMDRDPKLRPAFALGKRTTEVVHRLMSRLQKRITGRPRIVTDALDAYIDAVERVFGADVDYTQMTKEFGNGTAWVQPYLVIGRMDRRDVSTRLHGVVHPPPGLEYTGIIVTGFTGFLHLPISVAMAFKLPLNGLTAVTLADGKVFNKLTAQAIPTLDGRSVMGIVVLEFSNTQILVGMEFLRQFERGLLLTRKQAFLFPEKKSSP